MRGNDIQKACKKKNKNKNETDRSRTRTHRISWCHIFPQNIVIRKWIINIGGFTVELSNKKIIIYWPVKRSFLN